VKSRTRKRAREPGRFAALFSPAWLRVVRVILVGIWGLVLVAGLPAFVGGVDRLRGMPQGAERQASTVALIGRGSALFVAPAFFLLVLGYVVPRVARAPRSGRNPSTPLYRTKKDRRARRSKEGS
jgi:hypothetical protein